MQKLSSEAFKQIYFTDSKLGSPVVSERTLVVPVEGVDPLGSGLSPNSDGMFCGAMVFRGVYKSVRAVSEYIGDPKQPAGLKPPYDVVDVESGSSLDTLSTFGFEGTGVDPVAWIDWIVIAQSVEFVEGR